jgi:hypothetical protein
LHEIKHEKRRWQRRAYTAKRKKDAYKKIALRQHAENTSQEKE